MVTWGHLQVGYRNVKKQCAAFVCVWDIYIYIQVSDPFETLKRPAPGWGNILSKSAKTKSSKNQYHWAVISWHLRWHDSSRPGETSQIDYVTWQRTTGSFGQNDSGVHALGQNQKTWKKRTPLRKSRCKVAIVFVPSVVLWCTLILLLLLLVSLLYFRYCFIFTFPSLRWNWGICWCCCCYLMMSMIPLLLDCHSCRMFLLLFLQLLMLFWLLSSLLMSLVLVSIAATAFEGLVCKFSAKVVKQCRFVVISAASNHQWSVVNALALLWKGEENGQKRGHAFDFAWLILVFWFFLKTTFPLCV